LGRDLGSDSHSSSLEVLFKEKRQMMPQKKAAFLKRHSLMSEENPIVQQKKAAFLMYQGKPLL
jgi:hypothetical protein